MHFFYAKQYKYEKIIVAHKANIIRLFGGLFLKSVRKVVKKHSEVNFEQIYVDTVCLKLVQDPAQFNCLVIPNLYGDILSDICAGLIGDLALISSGNIGENGTTLDSTGQDKANLIALLESTVTMLRH